jgi:hypothetical protein
MSDFESKKAEALRLLQATGLHVSSYEPMAVRVLWRLGVHAPPPHFVGFGTVATVAGCYLALTLGMLMWCAHFAWPIVFRAGASINLGAVVAGLMFGLSTASYYTYGRRKYGLPSWRSLGGIGPAQA